VRLRHVVIISSLLLSRSASGAHDAPPPSRWLLGPLYGTGCPAYGNCGNPVASSMRREVEYDLDQLSQRDFPISAYHFDGSSWSTGKCEWALGDPLIDRLKSKGIRALLHVWGGCNEIRDALKLPKKLGTAFGGVYLDEGSTDEDARDAINGLRAGNDEVEIVMKAFSNDGQQTTNGLAQFGHSAYVNDVPSDFEGLRLGIRRVFEMASVIPAPFNEFTGYDKNEVPDEETYYRRLHWGAMQVIMDHTAWRDADPWQSRYSEALIETYRRYAWLHWQLVPYLYSYDFDAWETGHPVFRSPNLDEFTVKLGEEIFVAYVTQPGVTRLPVTLPEGEWVDFWDESRVVSGRIDQPVPLGREPIFIKNGALIPMQVERGYTGHGSEGSKGSLTVLVFPHGASRFRYRDEGNFWVDFTASASDTVLRLEARPHPSQPILYRIARVMSEPNGVRLDPSGAVIVGNGSSLPRAPDAETCYRSPASNWFYDAPARRLIVKVVH